MSTYRNEKTLRF